MWKMPGFYVGTFISNKLKYWMLAVLLKSLGGQGDEEVYCSIIIYFFTERSRHRLQTFNSLKPMFWETLFSVKTGGLE